MTSATQSLPPDSDQPPAQPARSRRGILLHLSVLIAVSFGLYARTLWDGFVADDRSEVLRDRLIRSLGNIPVLFAHSVWYFTGSTDDRYYRPLKLIAYSVEYQLFGFRPAFWHLVNILVNVAVVLAIYFLVRDLASGLSSAAPGSGADTSRLVPDFGAAALAFWTALFFAVHPIHVEAVAWVAGGNDLWCGLALLISLWLYHRGRSGRSPAWNYSFSVAAFFAGLLFKETALTFPAVVLGYDFLYRRDSLRQMLAGWRRYAGYVAALGGYLPMRWHALGGFAPNTIPACRRDGKAR